MKELFYNISAGVGHMLPPAVLGAMAEVLGRALWLGVPKRRRLAIETISQRLDLHPGQARVLARKSFAHNMRSFLEMLHTRRFDQGLFGERVDLSQATILAEVLALKRPVVVATGHIGAWELMGGIAQVAISDRPNAVVVRRPKDAALHVVMTRLRTRPCMGVVEHRNAVFNVLKILKKGGTAAFLVDHNCSRDEALFMPFLGRTAAVNKGPALLAVRAEALILPLIMVRTGKGRYALHAKPPLDTATLTGDRDQRVLEAATFYTRALEDFVRRFPEQWFWMHRRWKTQPPGEDDSKS